ncbi:MAG: hypothetical protein AAFY19_06900 [Pseudomonadota bacterium]
MPTKIEIQNRCLAIIGGARKSDPSVSLSGSQRWIEDLYDMVYDEVLALWPWSTCRGRHRLSAREKAPAFGFSNAYGVPKEVVAVWAVRAGGEWEFEKRHVLANGGDHLDVLTSDRVDPEHLNPLVGAAIAGRLAFASAMGASKSTTLSERIKTIVQDMLYDAMMSDNAQGGSLANLTSDWSLGMVSAARPEERVASLSWSAFDPEEAYARGAIEVPG